MVNQLKNKSYYFREKKPNQSNRVKYNLSHHKYKIPCTAQNS